MKILICDDNQNIVNRIKDLLTNISKEFSLNFEYLCFNRGDEVLKGNPKVDFAFIDIEMPGVNGLIVTKHLQILNPNAIIFIVTSHQVYLDEAMDLKVFRFLSKPIDENRIRKSMQTALNLYSQSTEKIALDYFDEHYTIFTTDILYLTIEKRKTRIYTKTGNYLSNKKFDYWKENLKQHSYFAQSHYSFIVNLKNVTDFNKNEVTITNNSEKIKVPISRAYYLTFKKSFYGYMGSTI